MAKGGFRYPALLALALIALANIGLVMAAHLWEQNLVHRVNLAEENIFNANRTGHYGGTDFDGRPFDGYLRSLAGEKVHSGFSLNTNSCASCHIAHTAPGEKLLPQRSLYNTCTTCHASPTMNTYNVLTGVTPGGAAAGGGRFFFGELLANTPRTGSSFHLTTGLVTIGDAPGARTRRNSLAELPGDWDAPFTCGSCHGAHGTYSGRHLAANPNRWVARQERQTAAVEPVAGIPGMYRAALGTRLPWYYAEESPYAVVVKDEGGFDVTSFFAVNHAEGVLRLIDQASNVVPVSVSFYPALRTGLVVQNPFAGDENVIYSGGTAEFCAACHVAYLDDGAGGMFAWHNRFYHPVNMDVSGKLPAGLEERAKAALRLELAGGEYRLTCLTCHFAHGTDLEIMQRRGADWDLHGTLSPLTGYAGPDPADTAHLRYFNPDNGDGYGGRFEACYLCHGEFIYSPAVTQTVPAADQTDVPVELAAIEILFNAPLYEPSLGGLTLTVTEAATGTAAVLEQQPSADGRRVVFSLPPGWLKEDEVYSVALSAGARVRISHVVETEVHPGLAYSFRTAPPPPPPPP